MEKTSCRILLISSNIGSVFEEPSIEEKWLLEFNRMVSETDPDVVALHCQEIGGKDFSVTMPMVFQFVMKIKALSGLASFDKVRTFMDTDFTNGDCFTALGSFYYIHSRVSSVKVWNFHRQEFEEMSRNEISQDETCQQLEHDHFHIKERYPTDFFPGVRWSRKGYLLTRWLINGNCFNLANIHLFHDEDNLVALEKSPSCYSQYRGRALQYTIDKLSNYLMSSEIFFMFGDFNFRLDLPAVVKHITTQYHQPQFIRGENGSLEKVIYRNPLSSDDDSLCIERRKFFPNSHASLFIERFTELLQHDRELLNFKQLQELPITFQPSYPFSEDSTVSNRYMEKRCPGWCDRIVMNETAMKLVEQSPISPVYNMMGKEVCTGDHKPVYLSFTSKLEALLPSSSSQTHEQRNQQQAQDH